MLITITVTLIMTRTLSFWDSVFLFNGSTSYIENLKLVYDKCFKALKKNGRLILFDVPKESAFGFMYLLGKSLNTYDHEYLKGAMPSLPYPIELASSGIWHTSEEKIKYP